MTTKQLQCPKCGDKRFSYAVTQIQFGHAQEFGEGTRVVETHDSGEILGDDISENGIYCTGCDDYYDMDELVIA